MLHPHINRIYNNLELIKLMLKKMLGQLSA